MGYRTQYSLAISGYDGNKEHIIGNFLSSYKDSKDAFDIYGDNIGNETKHYVPVDVIEYSKLHPEILFILEGMGDDRDDNKKWYIKNGKRQETKGIITYQEFDPKKLK